MAEDSGAVAIAARKRPATRPRNRPLHRAIAVIFGLLLLWVGTTGVLTQAIDLRAILSGAPATDPEMMAIRESLDGPPYYAVIGPADYAAPAFPGYYDYQAALAAAGRALGTLPAGTPVTFVELRMTPAGPRADARGRGQAVAIDLAAATARIEPAPALPAGRGPPPSAHRAAKSLHRFMFLGDDMLWIDMLVGIALFVLIVTGLLLYWQLLRARWRMGRRALFWSAGGALRSTHRAVAVVAALFLLLPAVTGLILSVDSFVMDLHRPPAGGPGSGAAAAGMRHDPATPLAPALLPAMLDGTLAGYRADQGDRPIKAIRLRIFAGMPQGVVIAGGRSTNQLVFNSRTRARVSMTEPGYPPVGFPTGWELHEYIKKLHRGDAFGVPGRLLGLAAGLALVYLSATGLWMYLDLWRRRRKAGRPALFWR